VQRQLHYAIVDEVDSILIDEARTPLIIRAPLKNRRSCTSRSIESFRNSTSGNHRRRETVGDRGAARGRFIGDEKSRAVSLTEQGIASCERLLNVDNLYDPQHITILHHFQQGLRAHACTSATWITS